jgi:hypothetical protein
MLNRRDILHDAFRSHIRAAAQPSPARPGPALPQHPAKLTAPRRPAGVPGSCSGARVELVLVGAGLAVTAWRLADGRSGEGTDRRHAWSGCDLTHARHHSSPFWSAKSRRWFRPAQEISRVAEPRGNVGNGRSTRVAGGGGVHPRSLVRGSAGERCDYGDESARHGMAPRRMRRWCI